MLKMFMMVTMTMMMMKASVGHACLEKAISTQKKNQTVFK